MSEYVPTTDWVREAAADKYANRVSRPAFNRWLAAHDREVKAEALREGARAVTRDKSITGLARATIHTWVYNYADRIESEARP